MKCDPVHQGHLCLMSRILGRRTTLWSSYFTSGTEPPPAEWAGVIVTGAPVLLTCQCWREALSKKWELGWERVLPVSQSTLFLEQSFWNSKLLGWRQAGGLSLWGRYHCPELEPTDRESPVSCPYPVIRELQSHWIGREILGRGCGSNFTDSHCTYWDLEVILEYCFKLDTCS